MINGWDDQPALALLAAMADVANSRDGGPARAAVGLVDGAAEHVFNLGVSFYDLAPSTPSELVAVLVRDQWDLAIQMLIVVAYAAHPDEPEVTAVDSYAAAMGVSPQTLKDLHRVRANHIKRLFLDHFRRVLTRDGDHHWAPHKVVKQLHEYIGSPKVAARYRQLDGFEDGTLGKTFFDFYRAREFALPGEKHSLGEFFVSHDSAHILASFNTDTTGELSLTGFEAGMRVNDFGWEIVMEVMLDFQLGIDLGVKLAGYTTSVNALNPDEFMVGIERGLGCNTDFQNPGWDFWAVAHDQVTDIRERYNILGATAVLLPRPAHAVTRPA